MGDPQASDRQDLDRRRAYMRALLDDVHALERMLEEGRIESGVRRVGAEQEFFLVTPAMEPAPVAVEVLERLNDGRFTPELARFNLEANTEPREFGGDCLRRLEEQVGELVGKARAAAAECGAEVLLTGILPTLQPSDMGLENIFPAPRYAALNRALVRLRGGRFRIAMKGIDELYIERDSVMAEACNTSFQVHFQVGPEEFAGLYNLAQAVAAPILAAAVNSPLFLDRRLWQETRVALFQHSVDDRSETEQARGQRPRVRFGDRWIDRSVIEIFREDVARFRVLLAGEAREEPLEVLAMGGVPRLSSLRLHNSTVYRWNRPCYGVQEGKAHLRIENRILPAGPTVLDEMANASFYFGLLSSISQEYDDITRAMDFDDAKRNFVAAARHGLGAQFTWIKGRRRAAGDLILNELLPLAREGLRARGIDPADIDRYLGVIEERVRSGRTGAQWLLDSLAGMKSTSPMHARCRAITAACLEQQKGGAPVHTWRSATMADLKDWRQSYKTVGNFMTRDLFTVRPDDLIDLAANLMDWEHIRHVPVEDGEGRLVGLVSHRTLVRLLAKGGAGKEARPIAVHAIMKADPITVGPETPTLQAIALMRRHKVGCLPVVSEGKLVGILTERDLIEVAAQLFDEHMRDADRE